MRLLLPEPTPAAFANACRYALAQGAAPETVTFEVNAGGTAGGGEGATRTDEGASGAGAFDLLAAAEEPITPPPVPTTFRVPAAFREMVGEVFFHRHEHRLTLLYTALWRLRHGEPDLMANPVDALVLELARMQKAVHRDAHKMKAFVRFRKIEVEEAGPEGPVRRERYVAWHRPDHPILRYIVPFFTARFGVLDFVILTPDESAHWMPAPGAQAGEGSLEFFGGVPADPLAAEGDALEEVWRTYYRSVFNPARLKVRAMKKELPVRHWATLPESQLIGELINESRVRTEHMLKASAHVRRAPGYFPPGLAELGSRDPQAAIAALRLAAAACQACPLWQGSATCVFSEGPARLHRADGGGGDAGGAPLVLVGEQPGENEDREGRPFIGASGALLDELLAEAGIPRAHCYLTEAVKHYGPAAAGRGPAHKSPTAAQVAACRPWLLAELAALKPALVVCLGAVAAQSVLGIRQKLAEVRSRLIAHPAGFQVLVTSHPAYVLRTPPGTDAAERLSRRLTMLADLRLAAATWAPPPPISAPKAPAPPTLDTPPPPPAQSTSPGATPR